MGKKNRSDVSGAPPSKWETERSLADAEADVPEGAGGSSLSDTACGCGHREFLVQGFFSVIDGVLSREPVELEGLTCPECTREYEAILGEGGRVLRGDFVGFADDED